MKDCEICRNHELCRLENKDKIKNCFYVYPTKEYLASKTEEYKLGYNKAIDDFVEKVELKYLGVHPDELYEKYYPREICEQINELAEQLKERN